MQKGLIKSLYNNFVEGSEPSHRCHLLYERIDDNTKSLKKSINKRNKKKLDMICNDYEATNTMEVEEAFADGFSFAVKLLSEAYAHKE